MGYQTSTEQILLLNNLLYCESNSKIESNPMKTFMDEKNEGRTVGEYVESILRNSENIVDDTFYSTGMTGREYKDILVAVQKDPELSRLVIKDVHIDRSSGGDGRSALFVDPVSNEAIVAFKGTQSSREWADNYSGISRTDAPDGVSTDIQQSALNWYQEKVKDGGYSSITVTGHSKGGNKAKYITIMDDSVDRCISQDGQGFSDEFMETYSDRISLTQNKITNHNTDKDFVNILLNDVGETTYYEGTNYVEGKGIEASGLRFAENHCTNTIFHFDKNGNYVLIPTEPDPGMKELDLMLNSYIRSIPSENRQKTGEMLAKLMDLATDDKIKGEDKIDQLIDLLSKDKYREVSASLIGYILMYKKEYPQLMDEIERVMAEIGMGDLIKTVKKIDDISNSDFTYVIIDFLAKHGRFLTGLADGIFTVAKFLGIDVPDEYVDFLKRHPELFDLIRSIISARGKARVDRNKGEDIRIPSVCAEIKDCSNRFSIDINTVKNCYQQLHTQKEKLEKEKRVLEGQILPELEYSIRKYVYESLQICCQEMTSDLRSLSQLCVSLGEICREYQHSEELVIDHISSS